MSDIESSQNGTVKWPETYSPQQSKPSKYAYEDGELQPVAGRVKALRIALIIYMVFAAIALIPTLYMVFFPAAFADDYYGQVSNIDMVFAIGAIVAAVFERLVFFNCAVMTCMFTFRAMKNLHTLGRPEADMSPTMSVVWYFVPIASWFMPVAGMGQIYRGSMSAAVKSIRSEAVSVWWGLWIVSVIGGGISNISMMPVMPAMVIATVSIFSGICAAFFLRRLVTQIAEAQTDVQTGGFASVFD